MAATTFSDKLFPARRAHNLAALYGKTEDTRHLSPLQVLEESEKVKQARQAVIGSVCAKEYQMKTRGFGIGALRTWFTPEYHACRQDYADAVCEYEKTVQTHLKTLNGETLPATLHSEAETKQTPETIKTLATYHLRAYFPTSRRRTLLVIGTLLGGGVLATSAVGVLGLTLFGVTLGLLLNPLAWLGLAVGGGFITLACLREWQSPGSALRLLPLGLGAAFAQDGPVYRVHKPTLADIFKTHCPGMRANKNGAWVFSGARFGEDCLHGMCNPTRPWIAGVGFIAGLLMRLCHGLNPNGSVIAADFDGKYPLSDRLPFLLNSIIAWGQAVLCAPAALLSPFFESLYNIGYYLAHDCVYEGMVLPYQERSTWRNLAKALPTSPTREDTLRRTPSSSILEAPTPGTSPATTPRDDQGGASEQAPSSDALVARPTGGEEPQTPKKSKSAIVAEPQGRASPFA